MSKINDAIKPAAKGIAKGAIAAIPYIGSTAVEIYDEIQSKQFERKLKRLEELYESLAKELGSIDDIINEKCVQRVDFLDIFEQTTRYIVNERNENKRRLFKNIFEHTMTDKDFDFDETEQYFRILQLLSPLQLDILAALYAPVEYNNARGKIIPDPVNNQWQSSWGQYSGGGILTRLMQKKDYEVRSAVTFLYYNGLVNENLMDKAIHTNANPIRVLDDSLTIYGRRFVKYLLNV